MRVRREGNYATGRLEGDDPRGLRGTERIKMFVYAGNDRGWLGKKGIADVFKIKLNST